MKKINILILVVILFAPISIKSQCDFSEIRMNLFSSSHMERIYAANALIECELEQGVPIINSLWSTEDNPEVKVAFLEVFSFFKHPETENFAYEIIDYDYTPLYELNLSPYYLKALATEVLFENGNYSTLDRVYDFLVNNFDEVDPVIISMLENIIVNVPKERERAKNWLITICNSDFAEIYRSFALEILFKHFNSEMIPIGLDLYLSTTSQIIRYQIIKSLIEHKYDSLAVFLRTNFCTDPNPPLRYRMADSLLTLFGSPSDMRAVIEYLPDENDQGTYSLIDYAIQNFIPPHPTVSTSEMIDNLIDYTRDLLDYGWITKQSVYQNYVKTLMAIQDAHRTETLAELCANLDLLISSAEEQRKTPLITEEAYKFLYYHGNYIKDNVETEFGECP